MRFTIAAGGITETGTTTTDTISANVTLGAAQTWVVGAGNTLTISGVVSGSANLTIGNAISTGILYLQGVNSYSGNITIIGGTLDLNSNGTMASAANITVYGAGNLTMDNSSTANSTRLGNSTNINMAGGNLTLIGSASAATTQNYGQLTLSSGESIITVIANGCSTDLNGTVGNGTLVINRSPGATVLFCGTNLGGAANITTPTGNAAFITFNTPIANTTTNGGLIGGALNSTSAAILPYALFGANTTDTGSNFVTYDAGNATTGRGLGIRQLGANGATETVTTNTANTNFRGAVTTITTAQTYNSLFFTGSNVGGNQGSKTVTVTSGAVATNGNNTISFLGGTAGMLTTGGSQPLIVSATPGNTFNLLMNIDSMSGGLTTSGGGTVYLQQGQSATSNYTGGTNINSGTLTTALAGLVQGNITFAGGTLALTGDVTMTNNMTVTANMTGSLDGNTTTRTLTYNTGNITVNSGATFAHLKHNDHR